MLQGLILSPLYLTFSTFKLLGDVIWGFGWGHLHSGPANDDVVNILSLSGGCGGPDGEQQVSTQVALGFRTSGFCRHFTSWSGWGLHYPRQNRCVIWEYSWIWSSYSKSWCQQWQGEFWHSYMLCTDCSLTGVCSQSLMLWSISNWTTAMDKAARTEHLEASAGAKYSSIGSCGCFSFSTCGISFLYPSGFNSSCRLWPIKPYMLWGWITCGIISPKLFLLVLQHLGREICSRSHQKMSSDWSPKESLLYHSAQPLEWLSFGNYTCPEPVGFP